ncbi:MAG: NUDIX domain-containing protein [Chitinivibrionales bacterium]|nr:NUDIX domain-containing protein [Chitinivibrionales bacterium]
MKSIRVVCAVVEREGKLLAAQRGPGSTHSGLWELPGGKIRSGENPADALRRELLEELGVRAEVLGEMGRYCHAYADFSIELIALHCRFHGEITCTEHSAIRWVAPSEVESLAWTAADIPLVRQWAGVP